MTQYIDKDAVIAEIDRRIEEITQTISLGNKKIQKSGGNRKAELVRFLSFINTLEVKEEDLNKEYDNEFFKDPVFGKLVNRSAGMVIAKHFFELGLKARIDENFVEEVYSHIDSIKDTADRMTSGNFMHHREAIKFSANTIAKVLELIGLKAQKGE